ncbi:MFS transporter [Streptomyces paludis]|uniref:MFS transporter n=1 Tax=Streptomyces paludis TaxID=2282738 RepID=A0A345HY59_9ACTN|nr:MFS transporter [Streptomyces paludis]AXG81633.1 MFS transporter [Streptomyces paludis]
MPLLAVCLGTFMLLIDVTIVSVALPQMSDSLGASFSAMQWVVDIYVLVLAALLMALGSLSDLAGARRVYLAGLVVFALASLACGLAGSSETLIAARGVQGLGAAAMFATNTALLAGNYQGRDRGVAFGMWGAVNGAAAAAGPIIGGLLTEHLDWRWIFYVNLPVAAIALYIGANHLAASATRADRRVDLPGTVSFTLVATLLIFALIHAGEEGWAGGTTLALFGGSALALVAFVLVERGRRDPMLDLGLLRTPSFAALMAGAVVFSAAAFANLVFVSVWAQSVLDFSPVKAGLILMPFSGMSFLAAGLAGRFLANMPPQYPIGGGLLLIGIGSFLEMFLTGTSGWTAMLAGFLVAGVGVGIASPILASAALAAAPADRAGMAGGAANTFRQLGFALGIPAVGTLLSGTVAVKLADSGLFTDTDTTATLVTGGQSAAVIAELPAESRAAAERVVEDAYAAGLDRVFLAGGLVAVLAGVLVLLLVRPSVRQPGTETSVPVREGELRAG